MIDFEKFTNYSQAIIFSANAKKDFYKNTEIYPETKYIAKHTAENNCNRNDYSYLKSFFSRIKGIKAKADCRRYY